VSQGLALEKDLLAVAAQSTDNALRSALQEIAAMYHQANRRSLNICQSING
jgi:hypothetical protein